MKNIFTLFIIFFAATLLAVGQTKPRIIVETDIGGDADDQATLVRFLLYANEFNIEGIILSRPKNKYGTDPLFNDPTNSNDPYQMTRRYLAKYGEIVNNLNAHAPAERKYPSRSYLESITKWAHTTSNRPSDAGVNRIIAALQEDFGPCPNSNPPCPNPDIRGTIWYTNWGSNDRTGSSLKRALDRIKAGGVAGLNYEDVVNRIRFVEYENLNGSSLIGCHLPEVRFAMDTFLPGTGGTRWAARWEALTGDKSWIKNTNNVNNGLSRWYTTAKEGDTMTWMHLIDNGINIKGSPDSGGWSGRYTNLSNNDRCDGSYPNSDYNNGFWKCNVSDASPTNNAINRDNTLIRWGTSNSKATDIINDFRARWKWTRSATRTSANHAPEPKVSAKDVNGNVFMTSTGTTPIFEFTSAGVDIQLDASASSDPDDNSLKYQWVLYKELTDPSLRNTVITNPNSAKTTIKIPNVNVEGLISLYLRVTDVPGGSKIPITRYQRVTFKTLGLPYLPPAMKMVNQSNHALPPNLIINRQSNTSYQVKVQVTETTTPISKIEFYSNGTKISEDTTAPYVFNFSRSQPGTYKIKARLWYNNNTYSVYSNESTITVKDVFIASIQPNSSRIYRVMENFGKVQYFTDRNYKVTILPSFLNRAEYIMTPNADKRSTIANLLTIRLNKPADVYVAYDRRLPRLPVWLRSYTDTREHVRTSDGAIFRLYKKKFNAGNVVLGGNESRQDNSSNYFVMVQKPLVLPPTNLITSIQVRSSRSYKAMANFGKVLYYTDRSDKVTIHPAYLTNAEYVKTPNSDKSVRNDNLLTLNLKEAADVYVAYDRRLPRIPVWLRSYTDTREHIRTSHGAIMRLYKKRFAAGRAVLGGNESRQSNSSNYFVIAKPVYSVRSSVEITNNTKDIEVDFNPYPIPTPDKVFVGITAEKSWVLLNIQGKTIQKGKGSIVDLSKFADGMYFIKTDIKTYKIFKKSN
ncbi:nucleoside hydrolase-like domain-containing protein [Aquimarina sp. AU474]|uniref:nucleoside hydrolase-like domain-containing protein n=1 Tax=Aquimarina sp. AU474 TaxID=2108529 RepID=UPI000D69A051|nr:nucleoside hydrolase-like domain-containing protein [Aquimarina sp. AU474]